MREELCQRCQQAFFAQANPQICEQCAELLFEKVKSYIQENQYNSMNDISDNTGVEFKYLDKWVKSGRLVLSSADAQAIREKSLNFQQQASQLQSSNEDLGKAKTANTDTSGPRFRFLDKRGR